MCLVSHKQGGPGNQSWGRARWRQDLRHRGIEFRVCRKAKRQGVEAGRQSDCISRVSEGEAGEVESHGLDRR